MRLEHPQAVSFQTFRDLLQNAHIIFSIYSLPLIHPACHII